MRAAGRTSGLNGWRGRSLARAIAAVSATAATLLVFAFDEHAPYDIQAGPVARVVAGLVPLLAAAVAGYAVLRPWRGFLAVLILTPVFDVAQVSLNVGPVQVISQTLFVGVLALGVALRGPRSGEASVAAPVPPSPPSPLAETSAAPRSWGAPISPDRVAGVAVVALLALATLSTAVSPDRTTSATILLHGILEPAAMAFLLLALRPRRRDLAVVAVVLAISVGLGGLLNMLQSIPAMKSLAVMQDDRLYFSRITYFNVGLFGEMLAMAMPILLAALAAHRYLHLRRAVLVLLVAAIVVSLASLFLTFSKSAYLATFGGSLLLVLLIVHSWRRRASIVLAACLLSTVLIPWPAFFLQVLPPIEQAYRNAMVSLMGESRYDSWNPSTLSGQGSLLERWYATRAGIEMAIDHPLLGIGLDQFQTQYVAGRYKPPQAQLNLDWAHSMYPEAAAELGLPALAAELRELLGPNPDRWLRDDGDPQRAATDLLANRASDLEGQEASSVACDSAAHPETPTLVERSRPPRQAAASGEVDPRLAAPAVPAPSVAGLPGPPTPPLAIATKTISPSVPAPSFKPVRGGIAAIRRSRRNLWIMLALATLALLAACALLLRGSAIGPKAPHAKEMTPTAAVARPEAQR